MKKNTIIILSAVLCSIVCIAGIGIGSILFPQTNVKVMQQDCHDYYTRYMQFTEMTRGKHVSHE